MLVINEKFIKLTKQEKQYFLPIHHLKVVDFKLDKIIYNHAMHVSLSIWYKHVLIYKFLCSNCIYV